MFTLLNPHFGCVAQPNSMLNRMNINFGCVVKPNPMFMFVNIDFGCGRAAPRSPPPTRPRYTPAMSTGQRTRMALGVFSGGLAAGGGGLVALGVVFGIATALVGYWGVDLVNSDSYGVGLGFLLMIVAGYGAVFAIGAGGMGVVLLLLAGLLGYFGIGAKR